MPELKKVEDSARLIRYAHPHGRGWVMVAVGVAMLAFALYGLDAGVGRWVVLALGALFTIGGISSALRRFEPGLDLDHSRLRYRKGSVFGTETGEKSFDTVERIVLKKEIDRRGGREAVDEWEVELVVRGWPRPIEVFESKDEASARAEAGKLASRLGVTFGERTGR